MDGWQVRRVDGTEASAEWQKESLFDSATFFECRWGRLRCASSLLTTCRQIKKKALKTQGPPPRVVTIYLPFNWESKRWKMKGLGSNSLDLGFGIWLSFFPPGYVGDSQVQPANRTCNHQHRSTSQLTSIRSLPKLMVTATLKVSLYILRKESDFFFAFLLLGRHGAAASGSLWLGLWGPADYWTEACCCGVFL